MYTFNTSILDCEEQEHQCVYSQYMSGQVNKQDYYVQLFV